MYNESSYVTVLSPAQHYSVGMYLIIAGILSGVMNLLGLAQMIKYRKALLNPSAIPEIGLLLSDLCVAGLHPFSGSAAMANRWIWGHVGCQVYGFAGFVFGTFQLVVIPFVAFDRYLLACKREWLKHRTYRMYVTVFILLFLFSVFWAAMPLLGWSSYMITPVGISCTIGWIRNDRSFVSYNTAYTIFSYIVPFIPLVYFYQKIQSAKEKHNLKLEWATPGHEGKVMIGCAVVTYLAFGAYGIVCIYAMIGDPRDLPAEVNILPPVIAKLAGVINPIFYLFLNPKMAAAIRKSVGLPHNEELLVPERRESGRLELKSPSEPEASLLVKT